MRQVESQQRESQGEKGKAEALYLSHSIAVRNAAAQQRERKRQRLEGRSPSCQGARGKLPEGSVSGCQSSLIQHPIIHCVKLAAPAPQEYSAHAVSTHCSHILKELHTSTPERSLPDLNMRQNSLNPDHSQAFLIAGRGLGRFIHFHALSSLLLHPPLALCCPHRAKERSSPLLSSAYTSSRSLQSQKGCFMRAVHRRGEKSQIECFTLLRIQKAFTHPSDQPSTGKSYSGTISCVILPMSALLSEEAGRTRKQQ